MLFIPTLIPDVKVIETTPFTDDRGFFERRFCCNEFSAAGVSFSIAQINRSMSKVCGTVRGLHFQIAPKSEMKIVQCLKGRVFDVAVDIRVNSPTFLKWHAEILSPDNGKSLCIPHGCAHGFQTLEENSEVLYFTDEFYSPQHEKTLHYADPAADIAWPLPVTVVSKKDNEAPVARMIFASLNPMLPT
jgi:dTDP-4-dehydrorhamnose 3,5-epimerase